MDGMSNYKLYCTVTLPSGICWRWHTSSRFLGLNEVPHARCSCCFPEILSNLRELRLEQIILLTLNLRFYGSAELHQEDDWYKYPSASWMSSQCQWFLDMLPSIFDRAIQRSLLISSWKPFELLVWAGQGGLINLDCVDIKANRKIGQTAHYMDTRRTERFTSSSMYLVDSTIWLSRYRA